MGSADEGVMPQQRSEELSHRVARRSFYIVIRSLAPRRPPGPTPRGRQILGRPIIASTRRKWLPTVGPFRAVRGLKRAHIAAKRRPGLYMDAQRERGPGTVRGRRTRITFSDAMGQRDHGLRGHAAWECKEGGDARHARRRSGRKGRRSLTSRALVSSEPLLEG